MAKRTAAGKQKPTLATVLVGDRPDSAAYVASKQKACQELGMGSISERLPADITQEELEKLIRKLNRSKKVNGILVQLPLPSHLNEERVLQLISIEKDVDGFSPINIGRLAQKGRDPLFVPCTPYGCIYLLEKVGVKIEGANAVVLGRSNIVGMPAALLLVKEDATVTICHSRTPDLGAILGEADVVVVATGRPGLVTGEMLKPGAVVVDVGINVVEGHLVGDVDFNSAARVVSAITPVPGGVGPLTNAILLTHLVRAARNQAEGRTAPGAGSLHLSIPTSQPAP